MLKNKKDFVLVVVVIFSLVAMYGFVPLAKAASMDSAKDTISDSDLSAYATHTVEFDLSVQDLDTAGDYVRVSFAGDFGTAVSSFVTCPSTGTWSSSTAATYVDCTLTGGTMSSTTDNTIVISGPTGYTAVQNPSGDGYYDVTISAYANGGALLESSVVKVYILDDVTVSAKVDSTLTFAIAGTATSTLINAGGADNTTGSTTATEIPFKQLTTDSQALLAQILTVSTNAAAGFSVTLQQNEELTNGAGATINSFRDSPDGTGTTTPEDWAQPANDLGTPNTYGHFGITSDDAVLSWGAGNDPFGDDKYAGLDGTDAVEVMYNAGPANNTGTGVGTTNVGFSIEVGALQEAGDYENTLTYICTPAY